MKRSAWMMMAAGLLALQACGGGDVQVSLDAFESDLPADTSTGTDAEAPADEGGRDLGPVPDGAVCAPKATQCVGSNFLKCKDDGSDWVTVTCGAGTKCTSQGCLETQCPPNTPKCDENGDVVICLADGSGYGAPAACKDTQECQGGQCIDKVCVPGATQCTQTSVLKCEGEPPAWAETPCGEGEICFKGACADCFTDEHCLSPKVCVDGRCSMPPLKVVTTELPDGQVDLAYAGQLAATGGSAPYAWAVDSGDLPDGVTLAADGALSGKPTKQGTFAFTVAVTDTASGKATKALEIIIHGKGMTITTKSPLPNGEAGTPYSTTFNAIGGTAPYGWMVTGGDVPAGLSMSSDGILAGTTEEYGTFNFTVRAVDVGEPLQVASAPFALTIKIAPLEIIGDQSVNLFLTKAVILPLITVVQGIPIPYSTQLKAKGGVKPYAWKETELSGLIKTFIPKAGIPAGLTLDASGKLSGSVTDTAAVFELKIPFVNYTLTGFFFMAEVTDAQNPADSDNAIFLIPTIPVNLGF